MRVEVVSWANCQMYSQTLFFALMALGFYFQAVENTIGEAPMRSSKTKAGSAAVPAWRSPWLWISAVCLGISLLTYPTCMGFVVVLLAIDVFFLKRLSALPKNWWQQQSVLLEKIPFVLVTAIGASTTLLARAHMSGRWAESVDMSHFGWAERVAQASYIWTYYLWRPFWPVNLGPVYTRLVTFQPTEWIFLLSGAVVIGGTVLLFLRRDRWPLLFALWICHLVLLVPMLGLTEHPHYSSDRYNYIESILWSVLAAFALAALWRSRWRWTGGIAIALAGVLAFLSIAQVPLWRTKITFYQGSIDQLLREGNKIDRGWAGLQYSWLGLSFAEESRVEEAVDSFSRALKITPEQTQARENLLSLCVKPESARRVLTCLQTSIQKDPTNGIWHFVFAIVLEQQHRIDEAMDEYTNIRAP
jgi:tetratricopeptide (TPR) repeat protein